MYHPNSLHIRRLWKIPEPLFPYLLKGDSNSIYTPQAGAKIKWGNAYRMPSTVPGP